MLFGGEMFRKAVFTAFMAVRRGGIEHLFSPSRRSLEALILALRRTEDSMHVLPPLTNFLLLLPWQLSWVAMTVF